MRGIKKNLIKEDCVFFDGVCEEVMGRVWLILIIFIAFRNLPEIC